MPTHDDVAAYWYDDDHRDCSILRQGDVLLDFTRRSGREYLVVVSQSCNLRSEPDGLVELAPADLIDTYLLENGQAAFSSLDQVRKGLDFDRVMLPRRPGAFESELLAFLDETIKEPARSVCAAVEAGMARSRAREITSWVVAHQVALRSNRPPVRLPIPPFEFRSARVDVDPLTPGSRPFPTTPIPLVGFRLDARPGNGRDGETWYRVAVETEQRFASTAMDPDAARDALAAILMDLRDEPPGEGPIREAYDRLVARYFA